MRNENHICIDTTCSIISEYFRGLSYNFPISLQLDPDDAELVTSPLRCLLNGPFRDLHFNVSDHRLIPVHDVVFLDDFEHNVKPLIYRPVTSEVAASAPAPANGDVDGDATPAEEQQRSFIPISRWVTRVRKRWRAIDIALGLELDSILFWSARKR